MRQRANFIEFFFKAAFCQFKCEEFENLIAAFEKVWEATLIYVSMQFARQTIDVFCQFF